MAYVKVTLFFVLMFCQSLFSQEPDVAQKCRLRNADCVELEKCPEQLKVLKEGGRPEICRFDGNVPIVCCSIPPESIFKNENAPLSMKKCELFRQQFCPWNVGFGVGGKPVKPKELPFMALVGYGPKDEKSWLCGGSLISERYVLSAAHCSESGNEGPALWVRLGELDKSTSTDIAKPVDYSIKVRINHPLYKPELNYHDLALFRLDREVEFSRFIKPVCLLQEEDYITNPKLPELENKAVAAGWGRIGAAGPPSNELMKIEIDLFQPSRCAGYGDDIELPRGFDSKTMICAGSDEGDRDTCPGDSGGPLVKAYKIEFTERRCYFHTQIGITSFGKLCGSGEFPGVYTNIAAYIPWIESIVWPYNSSDALVLWT